MRWRLIYQADAEWLHRHEENGHITIGEDWPVGDYPPSAMEADPEFGAALVESVVDGWVIRVGDWCLTSGPGGVVEFWREEE